MITRYNYNSMEASQAITYNWSWTDGRDTPLTHSLIFLAH